MTLVTRATIESLAAFRGQGNLATSLYLDTDKSRRSRKEIAVSFKKLLSDGRSRLDRLDLARETRESLEADLGALARFGAGPLETFKAPGLAVFGCSRSKLWEILELPHGPRDRIHFEGNFYVRPLASIVDRYRRICALTLDRREARWHEIHMGAIAPLDRLESPVPSKVRGVPETETKRAERRVEAHVLEHLKTVARSTFELFKAHRFDWLFLGCEETLGPDLEPLFHAYLRDRLKGRLKARVGDSPSTVLRESLEVEAALRRTEEEDLVARLVAELGKGGRACSGLRDTLRRLNLYEVQTLVVSHNLSKPGRVCPNDRHLYLDEAVCPVCERKTEPVQDVVDEAIETAFAMNAHVRQVNPPSKLAHFGDIGAFLKYKS